jgi:hypothetical protein
MKLLSSLSFALTLASVAACVAGCAEDAGDIGSSTSSALGSGIDVPNPSGAYFANITANGTGCPAGSWDAAISPDGTAFTVTFSAYEASVTPGQAMVVKDCTLSIDLRTPQGFSFSVSSFHYQGYALLDTPGMSARQTAKYYFMGNPVPAKEERSDMAGPYDNDYLFSDEIGVADLVWSPCGAERTLQAQTRLVLQNNPQQSGSGYLNTSSVDGQLKFIFGLSWKQCGDGPGAGPTRPVYRGFNPSIGDHVQGLVPNEGAPGWHSEGVSFKIYDHDDGNAQPLYRCRVNGTSYHFLSNAGNCEGQTVEGLLGYVSRTQRPGLVQIFRCLGPTGADHLTTANPNECNVAHYRIEGPQGWAGN